MVMLVMMCLRSLIRATRARQGEGQNSGLDVQSTDGVERNRLDLCIQWGFTKKEGYWCPTMFFLLGFHVASQGQGDRDGLTVPVEMVLG